MDRLYYILVWNILQLLPSLLLYSWSCLQVHEDRQHLRLNFVSLLFPFFVWVTLRMNYFFLFFFILHYVNNFSMIFYAFGLLYFNEYAHKHQFILLISFIYLHIDFNLLKLNYFFSQHNLNFIYPFWSDHLIYLLRDYDLLHAYENKN